MCDPEDYRLSSYDYFLPEEQIAQFPPQNRGDSRLMVLAADGSAGHFHFEELADLIPPNSLLVANNSRVVPCRLLGRRASGGKAEVLLLTPLPLLEPQQEGETEQWADAEALLRPAGKLLPGDEIVFSPDFSCRILAKGDFGKCAIRLQWKGALVAHLRSLGNLPLPPYIRRPTQKADSFRYQTVYASKNGSVAAPTAGLHFTPGLLELLGRRGHEWVELSLHVGYGTFSPVRKEDIREHRMHPEHVEMPPETAAAICRAKAQGRPIVAVGTTSMRAIEGVYRQCGNIREFSGPVNLFLYPGESVHMVDGLITNFHLPKSTLLMLVSAIVGRKRLLSAYGEALAEGYRFFSYGDAMLIMADSQKQ